MATEHVAARLYLWRSRVWLRTHPKVWGPLAVTCLLVSGLTVYSCLYAPQLEASRCMPYAVRADPSWDMRLIPHATCGDPVLTDQYVLTWRGARLTLTVAAVPSESSRVRDQAELSKLESTIHHTTSGQAYSLINEPQGPVPVLRAALASGGYSYVLKLQGGSNMREVREALVAIIARWQTHVLERT